MLKPVITHSVELNSEDAVKEVIDQARRELGNLQPQARLLFAGIDHDFTLILEKINNAFPGLELIEFPDYGEDSVCCGGGSGRLWMETKKGERFSDLRLEQAIDLGAEVLAVACPYCMTMFKDSQLTIDRGDSIEIKDISELVQEAL